MIHWHIFNSSNSMVLRSIFSMLKNYTFNRNPLALFSYFSFSKVKLPFQLLSARKKWNQNGSVGVKEQKNKNNVMVIQSVLENNLICIYFYKAFLLGRKVFVLPVWKCNRESSPVSEKLFSVLCIYLTLMYPSSPQLQLMS